MTEGRSGDATITRQGERSYPGTDEVQEYLYRPQCLFTSVVVRKAAHARPTSWIGFREKLILAVKVKGCRQACFREKLTWHVIPMGLTGFREKLTWPVSVRDRLVH